jgi:hypothetical protein
MSDIQNIPEESLPGKEPEPIPQTELLTNQPLQPMEVHSHGHVPEKKKWKEYVFQFIMLFLAVFLGFLAENLRERGVEREREKEYIESLVTDTNNDFIISEGLEGLILEQIKKIDTLQTLFSSDLENGPDKENNTRKCYALSSSVQTFYPEFFNERTISQLFSSGNMRLLKKQGVADSIMEYHSYIKFVEVQKQLYINSVNTCIQFMYNVYDISFIKSIMYNDSLFIPNTEGVQLKLLTTNPSELKKFNALLEITKIVAFTYKGYLADMHRKAKGLYYFLKKTYDIKE